MAEEKTLFGTDGIRGVANVPPMTVEVALKVGRAAAHVFRKDDRRHRVLIGKDTRLSGYMIENALVAGLCSMGVDAMLVGPMPTPAVAYIARSLRTDAGIVISASHNPYEDNGIKFFSSEGFKLPDEVESEIERLVFSGEIEDMRPTAEHVGKAYRIDDARGRYVEYVKATFPRDLTLDGMRIVADCANGAMYRVAPEVLTELGADVIRLATGPDGRNINRNCGSEHTERMQQITVRAEAHVGLAFDGDGDRVIMADETGAICDGDVVMAICCRHMIENGTLAENTVVATVMSNMGLEKAIRESGGKVIRVPVGDRNVVERMVADGLKLGGEKSGHLLFLEHHTTGDGLIAALQVMAIMERTGKPLSELARCFDHFPQTLVNVEVSKKSDLSKLPAVQAKIAEAETQLGDEGRVVVRPSGTQPLVRVMIEGRDQQHIESLARDVAQAIESALG